MAKSKDKRPKKAETPSQSKNAFIKVDSTAFDPTLTSLFASSSGPVQAPSKSRYQEKIEKQAIEASSDEDEDEDQDEDEEDGGDSSSDLDSDGSDDSDSSSVDSSEAAQSDDDDVALARLQESALNGTLDKSNKKRKRGNQEEIEDTYMRKVAREEEKEEEQRQKKRKTAKPAPVDAENGDSSQLGKMDGDFTIPKHESLAETTDKDASEMEKAGRTVFLSNVSTECISSKAAEKVLKKHLESFIADLADNKPPHKVESIRFRSTAFASALPKRAAFAKKEVMDATTKSTNAYAVYTTKTAAREAVKRLNGTVLLKRHLHVDSVAHPTKIDHRRCVFVGNLPFVDDESQTPNEDGTKKKPKAAADIEEGLWVHFAKAGKIESVRVVRDPQTRIGKGFAYVQFVDENGVEAALQLHEKKFPPMLPRILRVTRCKAEKKKTALSRGLPPPRAQRPTGKAGYAPKLTEEQKSLQGRARSMLGKVAKAQSKEAVVFEGHRASERQGKSGLKFKGSGGNKKKGVNGRKSRSSAWKKTGGKK